MIQEGTESWRVCLRWERASGASWPQCKMSPCLLAVLLIQNFLVISRGLDTFGAGCSESESHGVLAVTNVLFSIFTTRGKCNKLTTYFD